MARYPQPTERPEQFTLNRLHPLAGSLVFAGLGGIGFGSTFYKDSSLYGNHGTLVGYTGAGDTPADRWSRDIGRASLSFDGSNDRVTTNCKRASSTTGTFVWWQNCPDAYNTGARLSWWIGTAGTDPSIHVFHLGATWYVGYYSPTLGDFRLSVATSASNSPQNLWTAYALTWEDGVATKFYCNGALIGTRASTTIGTPPDGLAIGHPSVYLPIGKFADMLYFSNVVPPSIIARLADPSNVMLDTGGGQSLILPPRRRSFAVNTTPAVKTKLILKSSIGFTLLEVG